MNKLNHKLYNHILEKINGLEYDEDIKILHHTLFESQQITNKDSNLLNFQMRFRS